VSFAGAKDAQGESSASHTSRPGTAGDKRADRKPPISRRRLDQDCPGGVPHTERRHTTIAPCVASKTRGLPGCHAARNEGRATDKDAPRPVKAASPLPSLLFDSGAPGPVEVKPAGGFTERRKPGRPRKSSLQAEVPKKKRGRPPGCICPKCRVVDCAKRKDLGKICTECGRRHYRSGPVCWICGKQGRAAA